MPTRERFDLFTKIGFRNFFRRGIPFGDAWGRRYIFKDTLGHHICALIGHSHFLIWEDIDG